MTDRQTDVLIVGAGQAGLAMSAVLRSRGIEHVLLERSAAVGSGWRSTWDSLQLITPGWMNSLPGLPWPGPRNEFGSRDDVISYLDTYARLGAPVQLNTAVTKLDVAADGGFQVHTSDGTWLANQVVAATGPFQAPRIPPAAAGLDADVAQLHSMGYRRPADVAQGPVLVVGSGNSGVQIATELAATHDVTLSQGHNVRFPRRLTGAQFSPYAKAMFRRDIDPVDTDLELDVMEWLARFGFYEITVHTPFGSRAGRTPSDPYFGPYDEVLAEAGITPVGSVVSADGRRVTFADGASAQPRTIVWATGFIPMFDWLPSHVLDDAGFPRQRYGVTVLPGLYVLGLRWMRTGASGILFGVGIDAVLVANAIQAFAAGGPDNVAIPTDIPSEYVAVEWVEMLAGRPQG